MKKISVNEFHKDGSLACRPLFFYKPSNVRSFMLAIIYNCYKISFMNTCAWCNKRIPNNVEVFGLGAKVKQGIGLKDQEGKIISLFLALTEKTVPAIVATSDSEAKRDGKDLLFITCSQSCAELLKDTLQKEKGMVDNISMDLV